MGICDATGKFRGPLHRLRGYSRVELTDLGQSQTVSRESGQEVVCDAGPFHNGHPAPDIGIDQQDWYIEASVLGGRHGAVDIYIPKCRLCIMIDGQLHFQLLRSNTSVFTSAALKQQSRDAKFNINALDQNFSVLRLHHADHGIFRQIIFRHVVHFLRSGPQSRIAFSKSFPLESRTIYRERLLEL